MIESNLIAASRPLLRGSRLAVAAGHPLACEAATTIARQGGNAVDCAVAAAWVLSVMLPEACGLGGDALFMVRRADGTVTAYNGSGIAPSRLPDGPLGHFGAQAAVPGLVAALWDAQRDFGTLDPAVVLAPAVDCARAGAVLTETVHETILRHVARLRHGAGQWPPVRDRLMPGARIEHVALASLLSAVGGHGPSAFYEGPIAAATVAAIAGDGGALSLGDLRSHRTVVGRPLAGEYRGARVVVQPPVSQAVLALAALRAVEQSGADDSASRTHAGIEAIEAAFAHRDSLATAGGADQLLEAALDIDLERAGRRGGPELPSHTTAVAVADAEGTVVSMLVSVFDEFGCGRFVPEGGFFLNDRLAGASQDAASPNALRGGERPIHTLSPTLVEQPREGRVFALATPGADGQVQTLLQVIEAVVRDGIDPARALHLPRWRTAAARVLMEEGFSTKTAERLQQLGHEIDWRSPAAQPFGAAVIAGVDLVNGTLFAASDPRRETWAVVL